MDGPAAAPAPSGGEDVDLPTRAPISSWRMPQTGSKIPAYVRRSFRLKTFGLISVQLVAVLCIMVLVDRFSSQSVLGKGASRLVFVLLGTATGIVTFILQVFRNRYPCNYLLLAALTLLVGSFWGMGHSVFSEWFHVQVAVILAVGTCTATAVMALGTHEDGLAALVGPLFVGWLAGSVADLVLASCLGRNLHYSAMAVWMAFLLLVLLLILSGGQLVACDPDEFMRAVVGMDSTLMVVVSIPLFLVLACLVCSEGGAQEAVVQNQNVGQAEEGRP